jgi:hypothetical protein
MMFEELSVRGGSSSNLGALSDQEHKWHVVLSRDEVKIVSLDQLDDLYRLSIIDAETQVWQNGMSEWQALRVIAGVDEGPRGPRRSHPKPPRRATPPQPFMTGYPVLAHPSSAVHSFDSVRPLAASSIPARRASWFRRSLVALALLAGVSITLYRTGALREVAHFAERDAWYAHVDSTLARPAWNAALSAARGATNQVRALLADKSIAQTGVIPKRVNAAPAIVHALSVPVLSVGADRPGSVPDPMTPVVSLESLPAEADVAPAAAAPQPALAARADEPAAASGAVLQPSPRQRGTLLHAASKHAAILKASAPASHPARPVSTLASKPKLTAEAEEVSPVKAPKASAVPPVAQKAEAPMTDLERLNAAIGQSVHGRATAKAKSASKSNEYDPLNPNL